MDTDIYVKKSQFFDQCTRKLVDYINLEIQLNPFPDNSYLNYNKFCFILSLIQLIAGRTTLASLTSIIINRNILSLSLSKSKSEM